ncbi:hypothetical protein AX15_005962 [Amanita polypyramis BW_CC]|nr:hypothetical protein AX15_005962 [Amanita polypyramis BW_CC]
MTFQTENTTIIWFDYLMMTPSTQISDGVNKLVRVDDTDPSILYTGSWNEGGTSFDSNKTAHLATSSGSQAVLSFYGTSVAVFGRLQNVTASPESSTATFTLDSNAPVVFDTVPPSQSNTIYQVPIFQSFNLSLDHHQLQITAHDNSSNLWLDFIMYEQPLSSTTTSGTGQPTSSTSSRSSNYNAIVGPAVGGTIGGVVGFILIMAIVVWFRRRRNSANLALNEFTPYLAVESNNTRGSLDQLASPPMSDTHTYPSLGSLPAGLAARSSTQPSQVSLYQSIRKTPLRSAQPLSTASGMTPTPGVIHSQDGVGGEPPPYETYGV